MSLPPQSPHAPDLAELARQIKAWGAELGFAEVGISDTELSETEAGLFAWLDAGCHGSMDYMAKHGTRRTRPAELVPGTVRVITVRLNYYPPQAKDSWSVIRDGEQAFISRYALGRDYHKVLRNKLQQLASRIAGSVTHFQHRVFTDSAPVMEVALASKAGIGWRGKHTLLINRQAGSWFFLGEIYTSLQLPVDPPVKNHCGSCTSCLAACPTGAIVAPYKVDARRCISYLTIEHKGSIPEELRPLLGNRIYGCDDCQLVCPWNRFGQLTQEQDFAVRHGLDDVQLVTLFAWDEAEFQEKLAGTPIYRIGHEQWLRNIAVGLGNAPTSEAVINALRRRANDPSPLVREHVAWALARHGVPAA